MRQLKLKIELYLTLREFGGSIIDSFLFVLKTDVGK